MKIYHHLIASWLFNYCDLKFEIRISNFETISNNQNSKASKNSLGYWVNRKFCLCH